MARPEPREVWWAQIDKVRICVVLRVEPDFAEVVYGQHVHAPSVPSELVKLGSFAGKRLKLKKDTSFRGSNTAMLRDENFKNLIVKPCPASLFDALQKIVAAASQPAPPKHAEPQTSAQRVRQMHDAAVRDLIEAHKRRIDEPLVLAVRYGLDDPQDVYLLEVLEGHGCSEYGIPVGARERVAVRSGWRPHILRSESGRRLVGNSEPCSCDAIQALDSGGPWDVIVKRLPTEGRWYLVPSVGRR